MLGALGALMLCAAAQADGRSAFEIWLVDQSNTRDLAYGGAIHVYDGRTLITKPGHAVKPAGDDQPGRRHRGTLLRRDRCVSRPPAHAVLQLDGHPRRAQLRHERACGHLRCAQAPAGGVLSHGNRRGRRAAGACGLAHARRPLPDRGQPERQEARAHSHRLRQQPVRAGARGDAGPRRLHHAERPALPVGGAAS